MSSVGLSSGDPPPPRVSYIEGTAAYEPAGDVDWSEVVVNLPLLSGDRIYSHPESRVEVEVGLEDFLRLSEQTDVSFVRAVADEIELTLNLGSVILRVYDGNRYRVNTPLTGVFIEKKGLYRLTVSEDGQVRISVKKGKAEVINGVQKRKVETGQELIVDGPQSTLSNVLALSGDDAFDLWSDRRDARRVASTSIVRVGSTPAIRFPDVAAALATWLARGCRESPGQLVESLWPGWPGAITGPGSHHSGEATARIGPSA